MFTRTSSALAFVLMAACSRGGSDATAKVRPEDRIECALHGATQFARDCIIERHGSELIVRHPDGGFRRFERSNDTLSAADGAERAVVTSTPAYSELAVGEDRYRLPKRPVSASY